MTWVRFDDQFPIHRKVAPLDDATYRLCSEAIPWSSRNRTDGRISAADLAGVSKRATRQRAAKLVERRLWHVAGFECDSEACPPSGEDGWVIHDYWDYQPTAAKVKADLAAKAERTRRWRERRTGDGARDASRNAPVTLPPSPSPPRRGEGTGKPVPDRPAADHAFGAADRNKKRCPTCGNALDSAYHLNTCQRTEVA